MNSTYKTSTVLSIGIAVLTLFSTVYVATQYQQNLQSDASGNLPSHSEIELSRTTAEQPVSIRVDNLDKKYKVQVTLLEEESKKVFNCLKGTGEFITAKEMTVKCLYDTTKSYTVLSYLQDPKNLKKSIFPERTLGHTISGSPKESITFTFTVSE